MKILLAYFIFIASTMLSAAPMYEINPSYDFIPSLWGLGNEVAENSEKSVSKTEWFYDVLNELERIIDTEIKWNEQGLITYSKKTEKTPEGNILEEERETFKYDQQGRLVVYENFLNSESPRISVSYEYQGNLFSRILYTHASDVTNDTVPFEVFEYTYDDKGQMLSEETAHTSGSESLITYKYEKDAVVFKQKSEYDTAGVLTKDYIQHLSYTDDRLVSIKHLKFYRDNGTTDGNEKPDILDYTESIQTFTYDKNNNLIRNEVTADGELLDLKVYLYDDHNRILEYGYLYGEQWGSQWFGITGYEYDEQGRLITEYEKDVNGENKHVENTYEYVGNIEIRKNYGIRVGDDLFSVLYSYLNSAGDVEKKLEYDPDMNLQTSTFYTYDQAGNLIETVEEQDGRRFTMQKAEYEYY